MTAVREQEGDLLRREAPLQPGHGVKVETVRNLV